MPFVQITLRRGKSPEHIAALVESIHRGLVEEFKVPEPDKFQTVREVEAHQLIFPPEYLAVPHTEDIVFIHITCKEGRTVAMKKALFAKVARLIAERTGLSPDDVFIVISENAAENWSFGRGLAQLAGDS